MRVLGAILIIAAFACGPSTHDTAQDESGAHATPRTILRDEAGSTLAVQVGHTLYLNGVGPQDPTAPLAEQTRSAMDRIGTILGQAGIEHGHLVSCHVHLADMDGYAEMNAEYGSYFSEGAYPARTTIEMPGLISGAGVYIACIGYANADEIEVVRPPESEIPPAMGPYSPGVRTGSTVYLSGQGGRDPGTGELADGTAEQAARTMETVGIILGAAGLTFDNAVVANTYVPPTAEQGAIEDALASVFREGAAPSRSNVPLSRLPGDIKVEITTIAVMDPYVTRLFMHDQAPSAMSSPVSLSGQTAYVSAMSGTGETLSGQFDEALGGIRSALELAFMDTSSVVRMTAYLPKIDQVDAFRERFAAEFGDSQPALTVVGVRSDTMSGLALDAVAVQ